MKIFYSNNILIFYTFYSSWSCIDGRLGKSDCCNFTRGYSWNLVFLKRVFFRSRIILLSGAMNLTGQLRTHGVSNGVIAMIKSLNRTDCLIFFKTTCSHRRKWLFPDCPWKRQVWHQYPSCNFNSTIIHTGSRVMSVGAMPNTKK